MQVGLVGLGKMGANLARRLCRADIRVVGFDTDPAAIEALAGEPGFEAAYSVDALLLALKGPRIVWSMLPAGEPTAKLMDHLAATLAAGDRVVDGANGHYREATGRARRFAALEVGFVDAGVSGGIWGLEKGFCLMLGGAPADVEALSRVWKALAPGEGQWLHAGSAGAGHYVKMVHNGIEYGLMQAYAEGFALLEGHPEFDLDLAAVAATWQQGSVVRSWLLELAGGVVGDGPALESTAPVVADSGEGRWCAREAIDRGIPAPVLSAALMQRFSSQGRGDFAARLLALMRNRFGGHAVPKEKP